ncbi:hypothetical protein M501DRAFT_371178 [Patellaria atrata CBS 101060]|uniref:FHA domain-containing protein n=1 Tax=Patellaria atrata CBS 101060 TaxID=1346257 RepID=A0A9P4SGH3_9PEZI|nr:hypothetical protein M501DRAFT_371178 [Patellaria atrata CBS 101060]
MSSKDVKVTLEILNPQSDAGEPSLRSFTLQPGEVMPIGRASKSSHKNLNPAENNVYINSPVISREHATLKRVQDNENLYIEDCGSLHGTELNETKLDKNRDYPLKSGDIIRLGQPVTHTTETFTAPRCRVEVEHLTKTPMLTPANPQHSHGYSVPETDSDDDSMADDEAPVPVPFTVADDEVPVAAPLTVADDEAPVPTSFTPADNDAPLLATVTPPEGRRKNPTYEEITKFHAAAFRATSAHREASIGATKDKGKRFVCDAEAHSKPEDVSSSESEDNSSDGSNEDEDSRGSSYDSNEEEDESSPVASRHDSDSSSEENSSVASGEGSEDGTPPRIRPRNHREPNDGTPRSRQHSYKEYDDGTPPHGRQYYYGEYDDGTSPCARQRSDRNYDDEYDENQEYYENQEYDNEYDEGQEYDPEQFRNRDSADIYRPYRSFRPRNYRENHREDSLEYDEDSNYNHRNCREYRGSASWLDYGRCNRKDPLDSRREDPNSYNDEGQTAGFRGHDDEGSQGYHGYDRDAYHGDPREGFRTPIPPYSTSSGAVVHVHHASMPIPSPI